MLSVVIPAYNEEKLIINTAQVISDILDGEKIDFEIVFVNDGSKDETWDRIIEANDIDERVRGVSFSRNFGKESAMLAGLEKSKGDCAVVIDCDLQHPPEKIVEMYRLWEHGYEIVEGVKNDRGEESGFHRLAAKGFYKIISSATGIDMTRASDFKLLDRKAVNVLLNMPEKNAFFRALSSWIGFNSVQVEYDVHKREAGESKWSNKALIKYAVSNITSFSTFPMQAVTFLGVVMMVAGLIFSFWTLCQKIQGVAVEGFTTVIILQCFSGSIIMISIGIIGYYIAKIYEEIKDRPRYIISQTTDKKTE